jgi:MoaA/NifB/PqqE/SkfB family radical SAM enzyme
MFFVFFVPVYLNEMQHDPFTGHFRQQIKEFYTRLFWLSLRRPSHLRFWMLTGLRQRKAIRIREGHLQSGLHVPPVMIFSITSRCNLHCKGCYVLAQKRDPQNELKLPRIGRLFDEAEELGISMILLVGGEPLLRKDVLELAARKNKIIFPVFTNGLLFNRDMIRFFQQHRHMVPVLSIEGAMATTDGRRGSGVFEKVNTVSRQLHQSGVFYAFSFTVDRHNAGLILQDGFTGDLIRQGCRLVFFIEYVPENEADMSNCLTSEQKVHLKKKVVELRREYPAMFINLPGDEAQYGGCLAAGRGFIHVSAGGNLEPCPFAPFSDSNISDLSLREALQSGFLNQIRDTHNTLGESAGGCVLWENREWVNGELQLSLQKPLVTESNTHN